MPKEIENNFTKGIALQKEQIWKAKSTSQFVNLEMHRF